MKITYLNGSICSDIPKDRISGIISSKHELRISNSILLNPIRFMTSDLLIIRYSGTFTLFLRVVFARIFGKRVILEFVSPPDLSSGKSRFALNFIFKTLAPSSISHIIAYSPEITYLLRSLDGIQPAGIHLLLSDMPEKDIHANMQKDVLIHVDLSRETLDEWNFKLILEVAAKLPAINFLFAVEGLSRKRDTRTLRNMPPNCHPIPLPNESNLKWILDRSAVYLDLSGKSNDERMLLKAISAGLFPVVTDTDFLCKLIGPNGRVISLADGTGPIIEAISSICNSICDLKSTKTASNSSKTFSKKLFEILEESIKCVA